MEDFVRIIHDTPRVDEKTAVMLPGEREMRMMRKQQAEGIAIDQGILDQIRAMAEGA